MTAYFLNHLQKKKKRISLFRKIIRYTFLSVFILITIFLLYVFFGISIEPPKVDQNEVTEMSVTEVDSGLYALSKGRFRRNRYGLWELYIEGAAFERGVQNGKLTKALIIKQEEAFTDEIKKMIPSENYLKFLKYFIAYFNRNLPEYIPEEYQKEIYGVSLAASMEFNYIGSNYERILNYHGAHDIGHALNDLAMVGCTSFAVRNSHSADSSLLQARNFDFYVGDKFAEDKIVAFCKPDKGHRFAMIVWGGFTGVVSGMNDKGLTLTMNAAKSDIPYKAAEPISLIAREILQYAANIDEAYTIANKRKAFVSEAFMISSAQDREIAIIEITPKATSLFRPETEFVIGPNHFQSDRFKNSKSNLKNISTSSSMYRFLRTKELLQKYPNTDYLEAATILRNTYGLHDKNIGYGNEKALNQLIAHHSVIFKPEELKMWVSSNPFQLGAYVCYDLDSVFENFPKMNRNKPIDEQKYTIPPDSFMFDGRYEQFLKYKRTRNKIKAIISESENKEYDEKLLQDIVNYNTEYFYSYELAGDYCKAFGKLKEAILFYEKALKKEISTLGEKQRIMEKLSNLTEELE